MEPQAKKSPPIKRAEVSNKFIARWAARYVDIYLKEGKEIAVKWGMDFYHKDDIPAIAIEAKKIMRTRGMIK